MVDPLHDRAAKNITSKNPFRSAFFALVLVALSAGGPQPASADFARLTLQSELGDFIGQGGTFDITYPSNEISAQIRRTLPSGPAELLFDLGHVVPPPNTFALLFFGTDMLGIPMQTGVYTDAQRADFAQPNHPGLDVSFQNRGCNTLTGNFTVNEVSFFRDLSGNLQIGSFDASFEQHCEGMTPALFGTFIFQSSAIPEPTTWTMIGLGSIIVVLTKCFRCKKT